MTELHKTNYFKEITPDHTKKERANDSPNFLEKDQKENKKNSDKNDKHWIHKIKGWHLLILSFVLFSSFIIFNSPSGVLTGDEVFYYFQAQHLKEGELVWFEYTQPLMVPLVLSLYPTTNLVILKLFFSALFSALAVFMLYNLVRKVSGHKVAVMAAVLFMVHKETIRLAGWLYTESLFVFLLLVAFSLFYDIYLNENEKWWKYILLGVVMGFAIQTRVIGFIIPFFFVVILFTQKFKKLFKLKFIISLLIAGLITLIYLLVGGLNFLTEKSGGIYLLQSLQGIFYAIPGYLTWPFVAFFVLALLMGYKECESIFLYFIIYYLILLSLISNAIFSRYLFVVIPFACIFMAKLFWEKKFRYLTPIIFLVLLGFTVNSAPILPGNLSQNYYLIPPTDCQVIKEFDYFCPELKSTQKIDLPYFAIAPFTTCNFNTSFYLQENKKFMYLAYLDNHGYILFDNESGKDVDSIWESMVIPKNITKGQHNLSIDITNSLNIGGLGQVMFCEKKPTSFY